jgi:tetratricopeptide (TPR) repeat protein
MGMMPGRCHSAVPDTIDGSIRRPEHNMSHVPLDSVLEAEFRLLGIKRALRRSIKHMSETIVSDLAALYAPSAGFKDHELQLHANAVGPAGIDEAKLFRAVSDAFYVDMGAVETGERSTLCAAIYNGRFNDSTSAMLFASSLERLGKVTSLITVRNPEHILLGGEYCALEVLRSNAPQLTIPKDEVGEKYGWHREAEIGELAAVAYHNIGLALFMRNDLQGSIAAYQEGIGKFPGSASLWYNSGSLLCAVGSYQQSLHHFTMAVQIDPTSEAYTAAREKMLAYINILRSDRRPDPSSPH